MTSYEAGYLTGQIFGYTLIPVIFLLVIYLRRRKRKRDENTLDQF